MKHTQLQKEKTNKTYRKTKKYGKTNWGKISQLYLNLPTKYRGHCTHGKRAVQTEPPQDLHKPTQSRYLQINRNQHKLGGCTIQTTTQTTHKNLVGVCTIDDGIQLTGEKQTRTPTRGCGHGGTKPGGTPSYATRRRQIFTRWTTLKGKRGGVVRIYLVY